MKYVILRHKLDNFLVPVFCTAPLSHADLVHAFAGTHTPVSAGFCEFLPTGKVVASGFSHSLNLGAKPGDDLLIEGMMRATRMLAPNVPPAA